MIPTKPNEVFPYICHVIFAIILAISYEPISQVFTTSYEPLKQVLANPKIIAEHLDSIVQGTELALAYIVIISIWIGYSRLTMKLSRSNTKHGSLGFCIDLIILFCIFGLLELAASGDEYKDRFVYQIMILFIVLIVSYTIKRAERYENKEFYDYFFKSIVFTAGHLGALIAIYTTYYSVRPLWPEINAEWAYLGLLSIIIVQLLVYFYQNSQLSYARNTRKKRSTNMNNVQ